MKKRRSGIKHDYKSVDVRHSAYRPNPHWRLRWAALGIGCVVLGVVMAKSREPASAPVHELSGDIDARLVSEALSVPEASRPPPPPAVAQAGAMRWQTARVGRGDTFGGLLRQAGVASSIIHAIASAGEAGRAMARIFPGDVLRLGFDANGRLVRLRYAPGPGKSIEFTRTDDGFAGRIVEHELERRLEHAHGTIGSSLFQAGAEAGLSDRLIMELAQIFGWDIDFVLDIRRGDRFRVVYETFYKNGDRVRNGDILAAEFINRGRVYRAVRYTTPDGDTAYFAPDGQSMRKAFLRTPVEFTRISSRFGQRYHPTLHRMRNHDGVDYAAPTGTPIRATGDGRIDYRGYNGGYGRMIVIRHGGRYSTAYAHMSRYAGGTAPGQYVEQGEVIGYVGSTGRSTGPHLHYEFRVNGDHRNPLTVEFPSVAPIPRDQRDRFHAAIDPLVQKLETLNRAYAQRTD